MNKRIERAQNAHKESARKLVETIKQEYPAGCVVSVQAYTAHGERFHDIRVLGHGCEWSDPSYLYGENVSTGKRRRFSASYVVKKVLEASDDQ